jgi:hypothetical protein
VQHLTNSRDATCRLVLAHALLLSVPDTPVLHYGGRIERLEARLVCIRWLALVPATEAT